MNAHAAHINHPEAGRFDADDRHMMRQIGIVVAQPKPIDETEFERLAEQRAQIAHRVSQFVDIPV